jgi:hypothetical protein
MSVVAVRSWRLRAVRGPRAKERLLESLVQPEGLDKLKKKIASSGIKPATIRSVAQCLSHYDTACPVRAERA